MSVIFKFVKVQLKIFCAVMLKKAEPAYEVIKEEIEITIYIGANETSIEEDIYKYFLK